MTMSSAGTGAKATADGSTTNAVSTTGNVVTGQKVFLTLCGYRNGVEPTIAAGDLTKTAGTSTIGAITLDNSVKIDCGAGEWLVLGQYSMPVTGTGSLTLTFSNANVNFSTVFIDPWNGAFDSGFKEASNQGSTATNSTTAVDSGNATSAGAGLFYGAMVPVDDNAGFTMTRDGAFDLVNQETDFSSHCGGSVISRLVASGTTDSASWTIGSTNRGWAAGVTVYKEAASTAYTITADESTFTLTAQDAALLAPKNIVADQSTFTLSAQAATLTWSWGEYFQVEPADANTTSGESIFGGLTINSGSLVILPNLIGGIVATWETANGHATGRVSLASTLTDPTAVTIPYYNGSTWDTISVTFIDEGDITTTITADYASFTLSAQDANLVATRVITADQSTFALTVQDATLGLTGYSVDAAYSVFSLAAQAATLRYSAEPVVGIGQLSPSVRTSIRNSIRGSIT